MIGSFNPNFKQWKVVILACEQFDMWAEKFLIEPYRMPRSRFQVTTF